MAETILETDRLILREMTDRDFPALCRMLQDRSVMYAYEHAFSDQEAWEWLRRQQARYRKDGFGLWAAVERTSGEKFEEVFSIIRDINLASQRVARCIGMEERGSFIKHYYGMDMLHIVFSVRQGEQLPPAGSP